MEANFNPSLFKLYLWRQSTNASMTAKLRMKFSIIWNLNSIAFQELFKQTFSIASKIWQSRIQMKDFVLHISLNMETKWLSMGKSSSNFLSWQVNRSLWSWWDVTSLIVNKKRSEMLVWMKVKYFFCWEAEMILLLMRS